MGFPQHILSPTISLLVRQVFLDDTRIYIPNKHFVQTKENTYVCNIFLSKLTIIFTYHYFLLNRYRSICTPSFYDCNSP